MNVQAVKQHDLKCWPSPFEAVWEGKKRFEWRMNDRDYRVGDLLRLREWSPISEQYTGREVVAGVTYMLTAPDFGVPQGMCILSLGWLLERKGGD